MTWEPAHTFPSELVLPGSPSSGPQAPVPWSHHQLLPTHLAPVHSNAKPAWFLQIVQPGQGVLAQVGINVGKMRGKGNEGKLIMTFNPRKADLGMMLDTTGDACQGVAYLCQEWHGWTQGSHRTMVQEDGATWLGLFCPWTWPVPQTVYSKTNIYTAKTIRSQDWNREPRYLGASREHG